MTRSVGAACVFIIEKIATCVCYLCFGSEIKVLLVFASCVLVPKLRCFLCLCFSYLYKYLCLCACVLPRRVANLASCTCTSTCVLVYLCDLWPTLDDFEISKCPYLIVFIQVV